MTETDSSPIPTPQQSDVHPNAAPGSLAKGAELGQSSSLVALLRQQRDRYQQLQTLGHTQRQLVENAATEPLLRVLAQRQQLVDELARIHSELEPYRRQWEQVYGQLSDSDRQVVASLIKEVEQLLADIIDQDNHDQHQLEQSKGQVGQALSQAAHAGQAMAAYKAHHVAGAGGGLPITDHKG